MTFALSHALQQAVFARLSADPALAALVGPHLYDALPPGPPPALYVALGPEEARDRSDATLRGAEHDFLVSVVSTAEGFAQAKAAAALVCDALLGAPPALGRGRCAFLAFRRATAQRRGPGGERREIALTFRARLEDAPPPPSQE
ncbi:DUF3168 domain-containing protein [Rubellimicrobium sp. CFH 75288]|uniref:DUF3168 domain-containing protein n=1 Tax=Rubellimicrobium sp. CFH 75288 TaxID=2697034 RepID=UPI00141280F2|nr:DUF3168 domain-containing protein [Rubellimicrobium sp. CFH 75288]NAZ35520.1 DUF3168 domain-containing protein [Rubellimicrobium sp. CFH 75288]